MKPINSIIYIFFILIVAEISTAQTLYPKVAFKENPQTHNMHLASDGQFLYTCNGGKSGLGQINKYNPDGSNIASYKVELDMRSIMYKPSDKELYVYTFGKKLYRINDLVAGNFTEVAEFADRNEQCAAAISINGKFIYFMEFGELYIYTLKNGKLKKTLSGLKTADKASLGGTAVAVDEKNIFSWNASEQTVYIYNLKGKFQKSVKLAQGDYGYSLSYANGLLWVAQDGNYDEGAWYGYEIK